MEELTRLRLERGWSQQRLADESDVNKATINQIEKGRRSPNVETLEKLAGALGVEIGDFFPKAQAPLPFEDVEGAIRRGYEEAEKMLAGEGPFYTEHEAYGRVLASNWQGELLEWEAKIPEGECADAFDFGALVQWTLDVGTAKHLYEAMARDPDRPPRRELEDTLRLMEETYQGALTKAKRVFESAKTRAEFRKIWKANDLGAITSEVESR